jgi:hypothetical protein
LFFVNSVTLNELLNDCFFLLFRTNAVTAIAIKIAATVISTALRFFAIKVDAGDVGCVGEVVVDNEVGDVEGDCFGVFVGELANVGVTDGG